MGSDDRRRLPVRPVPRRRRRQHRVGGVPGRRANVAQRHPPRAHCELAARRTLAARQRPRRRLRRSTWNLADRLPRAERGPGGGDRRQPLPGRDHLERAGVGRRGPVAAQPAPRQGVDRLRQRRREPATRQLLRRLQRFPDAPARVPGIARRRAHVGAAGLGSGERGPRIDSRPLGARAAAGRPAGRRPDRAVLRREPCRLRPLGRRRALVPAARHDLGHRIQGDARVSAARRCRAPRWTWQETSTWSGRTAHERRRAAPTTW